MPMVLLGAGVAGRWGKQKGGEHRIMNPRTQVTVLSPEGQHRKFLILHEIIESQVSG